MANLTKMQLRQQMKQILSQLSKVTKINESEEVLEKTVDFIREQTAIKTIASYAALPIELNVDDLHTAIPEAQICYPRIHANGTMHFYKVECISELKASHYGIREPEATAQHFVKPSCIDVFLVPAYAYTLDGQRLGKGGGFYDRYLLNKREDALTVGIAYSSQIVDQIPIEAHDLVIDHVI